MSGIKSEANRGRPALWMWLLLLSPPMALAGVPDSEREALERIYGATGGPGWTDNSNWLEGDPCATGAEWFGVACEQTGLAVSAPERDHAAPRDHGDLHVVQLDLGGNHLVGYLPEDLFQLPYLEVLDLHDNQLSGELPDALWQLTQLRILALHLNPLGGGQPLPADIGNLVNLETLFLGDLNNPESTFTGSLPPELGNLTKLRTLSITGNRISGDIPLEFLNLAQLETLSLGGSAFEGAVPLELRQLPALRNLRLYDNAFRGSIPQMFCEMPKLVLLRLENNRFNGTLPECLAEHHWSGALWLQGNRLVGEIPDAWANASGSGIWLNISHNGLWTDNEAVDNRLQQATGGDWTATQTVAPPDVQVLAIDNEAVVLTWGDVVYRRKGRFRVWWSTDPGGPWTDAGATRGKSSLFHLVEGLQPDTAHYFAVHTETDPHANNANSVVSSRSAPVMATTLDQPPPFDINQGLNDAWLFRDTAGQGFFVVVFPDQGIVFLAWFTYDVDRPDQAVTALLGEPGHRWLTAQGPYAGDTALLDVVITSGMVFDAPEPAAMNRFDGTIELHFDNCRRGTVSYDIPSIGRQGAVPIERVAPDNIPLCEILRGEP